jgi:hypothetical protein
MNFEYGTEIAKIINTKHPKAAEKIIYLNDDESDPNNFYEIKLKPFELLQQIPNKQTERSILYVTGMGGSGKSYYCKMYAMEYNKLFKNRTVYLFSTIQDNDPSLKGIKNLKKVNIYSDEFLDYVYDPLDYKDSLVIWDDVDCIVEKRLKLKLKEISNMLLMTGRHLGTSILFCTHNACNGNDTKIILNECHSITIFIKSTGGKALKYLLENYLSLDKHQIAKLKGIKSRWVTIVKSYPNVILSQHDAYILN